MQHYNKFDYALPLIRIPSWITPEATLSLNASPFPIESASIGDFLRIPLPQGSSELVFFTAPSVRLTPSYNNSIVVSRGALIYSLLMQEDVVVSSTPYPAYPAGKNYKVTPTSAWNYALVIGNTSDPRGSFNFTQHGPPGPQPFASGSSIPVSLSVWARKVGIWGEERNGAGPPPASPITCATSQCGDLELVTLVPHGSTLLRMTAMPYTNS